MLRAKIAPHQRDILIKVGAHVVVDELIQPLHDELGGGLPLGDIFQFQVMPQPEGQPGQQRHHDPGTHKGLCDLEITQHRDVGVDGIQDLCAVQFHLLGFTPFFPRSLRPAGASAGASSTETSCAGTAAARGLYLPVICR